MTFLEPLLRGFQYGVSPLSTGLRSQLHNPAPLKLSFSFIFKYFYIFEIIS